MMKIGSKNSRREPRRRCLICFWEGWLSVAPSVLNAAIRLAELDCSVHIVTFAPAGKNAAPLPSLPDSVKIVQLRRAATYRIQRIISRIGGDRLIACGSDMIDFFRAALVIRRSGYHDVVIGVDTVGVLLAKCSAMNRDAVFVFWSLEFDPRLRWPWLERLSNFFASRFIRRASRVVVQDRNRATKLKERFDVDESRIRLVPNSAMGLPRHPNRMFLHERLKIDRARKIILHAGMISEKVLSTELARSTANWPSGYILIFHERTRRDPDEPYLRRIIDAGKNRVALSLSPLPLDSVDDVYSSASVGIVMYSTEHGQDFLEIGLSSGKLGYYLRNGVPIIVNANPSLTAFVDKWQCGVVAKTMDDVADCILRIEADYESFSGNATKCFVECLDFRVAFDAAFDEFLHPNDGR